MKQKTAYYFIGTIFLVLSIAIIGQSQKQNRKEDTFHQFMTSLPDTDQVNCNIDKSLNTTVSFLDLTCSTCIEQLDNLIKSTELPHTPQACSNIMVIYEGAVDSITTKLELIESRGICTITKDALQQDIFLYDPPFTILYNIDKNSIRVKLGYHNYEHFCP